MPLVNSKPIIEKAKRNKYAIGAFNIENLEMAQGVIFAAEEMKSPVICAVSQNALKYASAESYYSIVDAIAKQVSIPVALHFDHAENEETVIKALSSGFTSVMIDGSDLSFSENCVLTKRIVEMCKGFDVPVEGELGAIGGKTDERSYSTDLFTDPQAAVSFLENTKVDFLAVAIGTVHGISKSLPELDYVRLAEKNKLTDVPLVMHVASGLTDDQISKCISLGVSKVNIATELRIAYTNALRCYLKRNINEFDPRKYGEESRRAVMNVVKEKIKILGSAGKC